MSDNIGESAYIWNQRRLRNGKVTVTGANIVLMVFALVYMAVQILLFRYTSPDFITDNFYPMIVFNELLLILAPVLIYVYIKKASFRNTFRINKIRPAVVILIVLASVPAYFAASMFNSLVYYALQFVGKLPTQNIPAPINTNEYLVGLLLLAVLPAVCEEIMHRGLLFTAYERRGSIRALLMTSIIFGLFHFDVTNFAGPVFLGIVIGFFVLRTNSLFAGIIAHFLNNAIAETLVFLWGDEAKAEFINISATEIGQSVLLGIAGLIVLAAMMFIIVKLTGRTANLKRPISGVSKDIKAVFLHWPVLIFLILYITIFMLFIFSILPITISVGY